VKAMRMFLGLALLCGGARAENVMDQVEWRFAQAKPASRDDLFGAPAAPAKPAATKPAPKSKDDLFAPPPAAPKQAAPISKDELFGAPPAPAKQAAPLAEPVPAPSPAPVQAQAPKEQGEQDIQWSGYFIEEAAYTVSDPSHWSRAVSRLQLTGQGSLNGLKYKISARVDGDLVYADSDFYPADVREDQRLDFFLRENYIDFGVAGLDVRLGRQQIVWGEVVGLFFADVVSAQDLRDFILPSFDVLRIPQWAARVEYFAGDFHAEAIWIPVQSFDDIGKPGAEFYPVGLMAGNLPNAQFRSVEEPSESLDNSAYGLRMNTLASGWDLAAFYYRSHTNSPTFYREIGGSGEPIFTPRHDRIWKAGGTVSKDFGAFVLRGEAVYTDGQTYSVDDPADSDGVVKRNTFEYIFGLDFSLSGDTRFNVQGFHRIITGDDDDILPEVGGVGFTVLLSTKIARNWEPQVLWIENVSQGDRLIRPRLNWAAARNTMISFGADIFAGPETGFFGRYGNRDRLYTELRYDF
jgi:hypothetical protein